MCETVGFIPLTHNDPSTDLGDNPYLILRSFAEKASLNFGEVCTMSFFPFNNEIIDG